MTTPMPEPTPEESLLLIHGVVRRMDDDEGADPSEVLSALGELHRLREELGRLEPRLIAAARKLGISWAVLADVLGVASRQAAERRYLRLRPSESGTATADERVQAIRDRRAADRAVDVWARKNSALLRGLAGHLSSLDDLDETARQLVDLVRRALADDDPATLLRPLTDVAPRLAPTHPMLTERINQIIEETDRLRQETHDRRSRPAPQG
jgi:hypothetical protein